MKNPTSCIHLDRILQHGGALDICVLSAKSSGTSSQIPLSPPMHLVGYGYGFGFGVTVWVGGDWGLGAFGVRVCDGGWDLGLGFGWRLGFGFGFRRGLDLSERSGVVEEDEEDVEKKKHTF